MIMLFITVLLNSACRRTDDNQQHFFTYIWCFEKTIPLLFLQYLWFPLNNFNNFFTTTIRNINKIWNIIFHFTLTELLHYLTNQHFYSFTKIKYRALEQISRTKQVQYGHIWCAQKDHPLQKTYA